MILPSRNGKLLRNSAGIISADCGGPAEYSCPCTLLPGDRSACYGTGLTPSTYELDWGDDVKFCLTHVSGDVWRKTIGTTVITLDLSYDEDTAKITVVEGSVTVFSGAITGTSCVHRLSGTMTNTVSPSDWGSVNYDTPCNQPTFDCTCEFEEGVASGCFDDGLTPSTYIAVIDGVSYCLDWDSGNIWTKTIGELVITLDLRYSDTSAELKVTENGTAVFTAYKTGTSGIHRWSGSGLTNTITTNDWHEGGYYTACVQPDFACDCAYEPGTPCVSCYSSGTTPTFYVADFGQISYCLEHVSDCLWRKIVGDLTIELNLNNSGVTLLTVSDDGNTVFSGTITAGSCEARKLGEIANVYDNDWGFTGIGDNDLPYKYAVIVPSCQTTSCVMNRAIRVSGDVNLTERRTGSVNQSYISYKSCNTIGFLSSYCRIYVYLPADQRIYSNTCSFIEERENDNYSFFLGYDVTTDTWSIFASDAYWSGSVVVDPDSILPGEYFEITVTDNKYTVTGSECMANDYTRLPETLPIIGTVSFTIRVTLY